MLQSCFLPTSIRQTETAKQNRKGDTQAEHRRSTGSATGRQSDRQSNRQAEQQAGRQTNSQAGRQTDRPAAQQEDRQTDRQTERQTDRQTDRQTTADKQPARHISATSKNDSLRPPGIHETKQHTRQLNNARSRTTHMKTD